MPKREDTYEQVFNALAHAARRRVLLAIYFAGGEMSAGDAASMFAHAWQTTTRHLQVLERAGLDRACRAAAGAAGDLLRRRRDVGGRRGVDVRARLADHDAASAGAGARRS